MKEEIRLTDLTMPQEEPAWNPSGTRTRPESPRNRRPAASASKEPDYQHEHESGARLVTNAIPCRRPGIVTMRH